MGVFDYVNFAMNCPKCGKKLEFQTKDGDPYMNTVEPEATLTFGAWCAKCNVSVDFSRLPQTDELPPREQPLTLEQVQALGFRMTTDAV